MGALQDDTNHTESLAVVGRAYLLHTVAFVPLSRETPLKMTPTREKDDLFVLLTDAEERKLARWVMGLMAKVWFDARCGKIYDLVRRLYWLKCERGFNLRASLYASLTEAIHRWNERYEAGSPWAISTEVLEIDEDGQCRKIPTMNAQGKPYTNAQRAKIRQTDTRQVWREEWQDNEALKGRDDAFLVFPGDDQGKTYADIQRELERRFWAEVERRRGEWTGISSRDLERLVADYMPRGDPEALEGD